MTAAGDERLPPSIGGLIELAFSAYAERARLYLGLALIVFALCGLVELSWPYVGTHPELKDELVEPLVELFVESLLVAAVALGIGTRVAGGTAAAQSLVDGAFARWLPVIGTLTIVTLIVDSTAPASGLLGFEGALAVVAAPFCWLLWGALGLAGPIAALSPDRSAIAILTSFGRALALGLRLTNVPRLCIVALATVVPLLLEAVLANALQQRHVPHALFWAGIPIDALVAGPLAALQTVFALDFARRLGRLDKPR